MRPIRLESIDTELARVNHFALAKHHLTPGARSDDLVRIAGDVGGLHATGVTTPYLSLLARTRTFARDDLEEELYERRTLAKLRCVSKRFSLTLRTRQTPGGSARDYEPTEAHPKRRA
jgi:hypothetical protein